MACPGQATTHIYLTTILPEPAEYSVAFILQSGFKMILNPKLKTLCHVPGKGIYRDAA